MAEKVLAAVRVAPSKTELREFPMPDIPADAVLLKMEVAGICGTDVKLYKHPPFDAPVIMGHENIGTIAKAGSEFTRRKGFKEGDLVFVEDYIMCGRCEWCHRGEYRHCENADWRNNPDAIRYGYTPAEKAPHLWGGFAQYVYLPWNAVVHRVPKGVTPELAGLVTPMANGVEWSLFDGGVGYNSLHRTPVGILFRRPGSLPNQSVAYEHGQHAHPTRRSPFHGRAPYFFDSGCNWNVTSIRPSPASSTGFSWLSKPLAFTLMM